jgi:2-polyprenyl-3-methyl-5-hydroxy-6-metoxy-1,4-benzoquinol methylase
MIDQAVNEFGSERLTCSLCGSVSAVLYARMNDRLFGSPGLWDYRQCGNPQCRFVWLDPMPTKRQLEEAYANYYTHNQNAPMNRRQLVHAYIMRTILHAYTFLLGGTPIARAIREADRLYLGNVQPGRLLEVGCGDGRTMNKMKDLGWQVEGQEIDLNATRVAAERTGLPVHCGELECLEIPKQTYDAIVMIHVIEHVLDPVAMLKACNRLLKPGGVLVVVTPNVESLGHRKFGRHWRDIDAPRHLQVFSRITLTQVAEAAGFKDNNVTTTMAHAHFVAGASIAVQRREALLSNASKLGWKTAFGAALFQFREAYALMRDTGCGEECVLIARANA